MKPPETVRELFESGDVQAIEALMALAGEKIEMYFPQDGQHDEQLRRFSHVRWTVVVSSESADGEFTRFFYEVSGDKPPHWDHWSIASEY